METVEYLVVAVAADLVVVVYESVMDVASCDEFGKDVSVLGQDGPEPLELRLLFAVYSDPVSLFKALSDVLGKEFEVLVEYRLRGYIEFHCILILAGKRQLHVYAGEFLEIGEEFPIPVHVGRVQPYERISREDIGDADHLRAAFGIRDVGIDFGFMDLLFRQLGVAVEYRDGVDLITEERDTERVVV